MPRKRFDATEARQRRPPVQAWTWAVLVAAVAARFLLADVGGQAAVAGGWLLLLAILVVPVVIAVRGLARLASFDRRHRRGELQRRFDARLCTECGYDLRTLPDRCPECGAPREKWWA